MGITGGLVKSVFSKSRSFGTHDNNARSNVAEKRRWNSVRTYLCGEEMNLALAVVESSEAAETFTQLSSVQAEKDSASAETADNAAAITQLNSGQDVEGTSSVDCSEATVTQPIQEEQEQPQKLAQQAAATIIQSAFRGFLAARRRVGGTKLVVVGNGSPNRESLGTSVEVQTGNSAEIFSSQTRTNRKFRTQVMKEDWDDSTVSSIVSKMRVQNRLEATTRRERALAYAFSQQLRICSRKKETKTNSNEPNMGWSWLERWMATRLPESSSVESCVTKPVVEPIFRHQRVRTGKGRFDITGEEKESCGSNEVSITFDSMSVKSVSERDRFKPTINRKTAQTISRRKSNPSYRCPKDYTKVKKEGSFKGDFRRQRHEAK